MKRSLTAAVVALGVAGGLVTAPAPESGAAPAVSPDSYLSRHVGGRYIVVLGARMNPDGSAPRILERRLDTAARLWHRHPGRRIVATGGDTWWLPIPEATFMQGQLLARGVPPTAVDLETRSQSTAENARNTVALLRARRARGAVVVTNRFHMARALDAFRYQAHEQGVRLRFVPGYA